MSRDIKFKIWNKEEKKFLEINWEGEDTRHTKGKANICYSDRVYVTLSGYVNEDGWPYEVDADILQYTGLKDKNGKEIYEGDILRCKCLKKCKLDSCAKKVIQYKNSLIEWWKSGYNLGYRLRDSKGKTMMIKPTHLNTMEVEVIGNIYENPELLEGEK